MECHKHPSQEFSTILRWKEEPNDPTFLRLNPYFRGKLRLSLGINVNCNNSGRIIIIYPGADESNNGPDQRYKNLADFMDNEKLGAVIRSGNLTRDFFLPSTNLKAMIDFAKDRSQYICNSKTPKLLLMGYSAGASAVAALASSYQEISRILLIAPSGDMPREFVASGLENFKGEVYIVMGNSDEIIPPRAGQIYYDLAKHASKKKLFMIPDCDHYFRGEINDTIFKQAPFYAFAKGERPTFLNKYYAI